MSRDDRIILHLPLVGCVEARSGTWEEGRDSELPKVADNLFTLLGFR
jgi:hypothetical protein